LGETPRCTAKGRKYASWEGLLGGKASSDIGNDLPEDRTEIHKRRLPEEQQNFERSSKEGGRPLEEEVIIEKNRADERKPARDKNSTCLDRSEESERTGPQDIQKRKDQSTTTRVQNLAQEGGLAEGGTSREASSLRSEIVSDLGGGGSRASTKVPVRRGKTPPSGK